MARGKHNSSAFGARSRSGPVSLELMMRAYDALGPLSRAAIDAAHQEWNPGYWLSIGRLHCMKDARLAEEIRFRDIRERAGYRLDMEAMCRGEPIVGRRALQRVA